MPRLKTNSNNLKEAKELKHCSECYLPHWSVKLGKTCLACRYFEIVRHEKLSFIEIIDFIKHNQICAYCR
jgi:hypothetical protein